MGDQEPPKRPSFKRLSDWMKNDNHVLEKCQFLSQIIIAMVKVLDRRSSMSIDFSGVHYRTVHERALRDHRIVWCVWGRGGCSILAAANLEHQAARGVGGPYLTQIQRAPDQKIGGARQGSLTMTPPHAVGLRRRCAARGSTSSISTTIKTQV
jgi:hypothetical protein